MSDSYPSRNHESEPGLPPVQPPSARFIVQLFIIPAMIIAVMVALYLGASFLFRSNQTPAGFLRELDSGNADIRWRGASDLAQILKRPDSIALASDPTFALDIAERLRQAVEDLELAEEKVAAEITRREEEYKKISQTMPQTEKDLAWRKLRPDRNYIRFLIACLGEFNVPVGAPLLNQLAVKDVGKDPNSLLLRRQGALLALASLGNNYRQHYLGLDVSPQDKVLSQEQKDKLLATLEEEVDRPQPRGDWAAKALGFLKGKNGLGVESAMEQCASAENPFLRELTTFTLRYWNGGEERIVRTLLLLSKDNGHGKRVEFTEAD